MIHHSCGPRTLVDHNLYLGGFFDYALLSNCGVVTTVVTCLGTRGTRTLGFDYSQRMDLEQQKKSFILDARMNNTITKNNNNITSLNFHYEFQHLKAMQDGKATSTSSGI